MGSAHSINNTILGESILGNIYRTRVPVQFGTSGYDKNYDLKKYESSEIILNPHVDGFYVKLDPGLRFVVRDVNITWGIDAGANLQITIKLLDNIEISLDTPVSDVIPNSRMSTYGLWNYTTVRNTENPLLIYLTSAPTAEMDNTIIKTTGLQAHMYVHDFTDNSNRGNTNKPFRFNTEMVEYIGRYHQ